MAWKASAFDKGSPRPGWLAADGLPAAHATEGAHAPAVRGREAAIAHPDRVDILDQPAAGLAVMLEDHADPLGRVLAAVDVAATDGDVPRAPDVDIVLRPTPTRPGSACRVLQQAIVAVARELDHLPRGNGPRSRSPRLPKHRLRAPVEEDAARSPPSRAAVMAIPAEERHRILLRSLLSLAPDGGAPSVDDSGRSRSALRRLLDEDAHAAGVMHLDIADHDIPQAWTPRMPAVSSATVLSPSISSPSRVADTGPEAASEPGPERVTVSASAVLSQPSKAAHANLFRAIFEMLPAPPGMSNVTRSRSGRPRSEGRQRRRRRRPRELRGG